MIKKLITLCLLEKLKELFLVIMIIVCFYVFLTSAIYQFKNPHKTQTQVFLHVVESFKLNFNK